MYVNKSDNKIVIAQATHNNSTAPRLTAKQNQLLHLQQNQQASTCLIKETCNSYQPLITLASLGAKGQSPHSWEKHLSTLKDSRDKSPYFIVDVNSSTDSHSRSPIRMSKKDNSSNDFDFFTYSFIMTILVMTIATTSIEEQLTDIARAIAKLTKTIKEKNLQITSFMNKVEAQAQNMVESCQGLTLQKLCL